ncbi:PKD domain-containing protein [Vibrio vulnificus]|uniref:PKD domain-containing protein n=1 Tax=Vibrio vulnificus TaxID=672 RepID=UPI003ED88692
MCNLLKIVLIATLLFLAGCDVDDASDATKYTKPTVNAGSDQYHTLPIDTITLHGSAKSWPKLVFSIKTKQWRQISGPQSLTILNDDSFTATLLNPTVAGTYIFELYAKDSGDRANTDRVKIVLRDPQPVAAARNSLSYEDDYQQLWQSVATNYPHYDQIQDEWQQRYQPYLIKAAQAQNEEQWRSLVEAMFTELSGSRLTAIQSPSAEQWRANPTKALAVRGRQDNGIGLLEIGALHEQDALHDIGELHEIGALHDVSLADFTKQLDDALMQLKGVSEIRLEIKAPNALGEQALFTLLEKLTTRAALLCISPNKEASSCVSLPANSDLDGVALLINPTCEQSTCRILSEYLSYLHSGEQHFYYMPSPVIDSHWRLVMDPES